MRFDSGGRYDGSGAVENEREHRKCAYFKVESSSPTLNVISMKYFCYIVARTNKSKPIEK